jgi:hypothetical protein
MAWLGWPWRSKKAATAPHGDRSVDALADVLDEIYDAPGHPQCGPANDPANPAALRGSSPPIVQENRGPAARFVPHGTPHCGDGTSREPATPCGDGSSTRPAPQGEPARDPADLALETLALGWREAARQFIWSASARDLAVEFRRRLQERPDLIGRLIPYAWIKQAYVPFCRSVGLSSWPPLTKFAAELKHLMPKDRPEIRRGGKRVATMTAYLVPDPAAAIVDLSQERRKLS